MVFDAKTLMLLNFFINLVSAGTMLSLWLRHKNRYHGIFLWFINAFLQICGSLLVLLRDQVPDSLSIVLANTMLIAGTAALFAGLGLFFGKKTSPVFSIAVLLFFLASMIYFSVFQPDLTIREIIVSTAVILVNSQSCRLLFHRIDTSLNKETRSTGVILGIYVVANFFRILLLLLFPMGKTSFFDSDLLDSAVLVCTVILGACLNISLALMVNHKLIREIKFQEEKFTVAFQSSPNAIFMARLSDGCIYEVNEGFVNITGYAHDEAIGRTASDLNLWVDAKDTENVVDALADKFDGKDQEFRFRKKSGEIFIGLFSKKPIFVNDEIFILFSISDITELSQMKQRMEELASHDFLTGLPNRMLFYHLFDTAIPEAMKMNRKLAILSLDLDNFKTINDLYGHGAGDDVLVEIARRLQFVLGEKNIAARLGGDEFILLLYEITRKEDVKELVRRILESLNQSFKIEDEEFYLSVSIGITLFPDDASDMESLIFKSDEAMYYVKGHGKNNYKFYSDMV